MPYRKNPQGRAKPFVVSCRLRAEDYQILKEYLQSRNWSVQYFLERIIVFVLSFHKKPEEVERNG